MVSMSSSAEKDLKNAILQVRSKLDSPPINVEELLSLLSNTESVLSNVQQSPSESIFHELRPIMRALVAKDLLEHPDIDVRVHVTACITEITRITVPDEPYNDNKMKLIFKAIVEAFRDLDDTSSRSFQKRVSILETMACVRLSLVMLDLECNDLILEMFRHFLMTIRSYHPECVFPLMMMIMTHVLEESDDISPDLLSCLFDSVKKENKDTLPTARQLGEQVITKCAATLKPYLVSYAPGDYSKILRSICEDNAGALEAIVVNTSSKIMEFTKPEQEVASLEKVGALDKSSHRSPRLSTGILQRRNVDSEVELASTKQNPEQPRCTGQAKNNVSVNRTDNGILDSVYAKLDGSVDLNDRPEKRLESTEVAQNYSDKNVPLLPSKFNNQNKEVFSLKVDVLSGKEAVRSISAENSEHEIQAPRSAETSDHGNNIIISLRPGGNAPDACLHESGRPHGSKSSMEKSSNSVLDQSTSALIVKVDQGRNQIKDALLPSKENAFKKKLEGASNSKGKFHVGQKVPLDNIDDAVARNSEAKPEVNAGKRKRNRDTKSSRKEQRSGIKQPKGSIDNQNDVAVGSSLKDVQTSSESGKICQKKGRNHLKGSLLPSKENALKKKLEGASNSKGKFHVGQKAPLDNIDDAVARNSEAKPAVNAGKRKRNRDTESSRKEQRSGIKQPKGSIDNQNDVAVGSSLKDVQTSSESGKICQKKGRNHLKGLVLPSKENALKKKLEGASNSKGKFHVGQKVPLDNIDYAVARNSEAKPAVNAGKRKRNRNTESSRKEHRSGIKQPKGSIDNQNDVAVGSSLKDVQTSSEPGKICQKKGRNHLKGSLLPSKENALKKKLEGASNSKGKFHVGQKVPLDNTDDTVTTNSVARNSEAKGAVNAGKRKKKRDVESSRKEQRSDIKQPKGKIDGQNDVAVASSLKDVQTSSESGKICQKKGITHLKDSIKTNLRKHSKGIEKISETPDHKPKLDQSLVGSAIQVWWPQDRRLYNGAVDSFDPSTGKHKIVYDDGETEVLFLKKERFTLGKDNVGTEEDGKKVDTNLIESQKVKSRKRKPNQDSMPKQLKTEVSLESGTESGCRRRRPRGGATKFRKFATTTGYATSLPRGWL